MIRFTRPVRFNLMESTTG